MSHSVNNNCVKQTIGKPIMWDETDGRGGPSFSDTWVLRIAKKCQRWQVDMLMRLALSVVLIQCFCGSRFPSLPVLSFTETDELNLN